MITYKSAPEFASIELRDGEICLQLTSCNDDHFRAISEEKLRGICFDEKLDLDQKREAVWEASREFFVSRTGNVDLALVADGTEDEASWQDLAAYFEAVEEEGDLEQKE